MTTDHRTFPEAHPGAHSHPAFEHIDHRPWPLPAGRWAWRQSWRDLLFAHWPVDVAAVQALLPAGLRAQAFEGVAWVGIVPFRMAGVMRRPLPDLPWISAFPELNVRVYVEAGGKPGVWFLSLDATNSAAVAAARLLFHLPYYWARIRVKPEGEAIAYACARRGGAARFEARYRPVSAVYAAAPDTLEHFLTERYCLYAARADGTLWRTEVHHWPWPLQRAEAEIGANNISAAGRLPVSGPAVLLHFARRIDVVIWPPERIEGQSP
jgi:uncharacterized protein YqjF (DUF2071 family)